MNRYVRVVIAAGVVLILGSYACVTTVEHNEKAVVTTFGRFSRLIEQPGLHLRWPWPVQEVLKQPTTVQAHDEPLVELPTRDGAPVLIGMEVFWRVSDPQAFFQTTRTQREADATIARAIEGARRAAMAEVAAAELTGPTSGVVFDRLEARVAELAQQSLSGAVARGLVIERVAVTRLQLPESAMTQLAEGMVRARQRLAQDVRSEGASQAEKIRSEAQTASRAIMAVAQAQAQEIRAAGEADAATHYVRMAQDERLAVLLRELEALPRLFGGNVTFTLDAQRSGLTGLSRLLLDGPEAVGDACVSAASSPAGEVTDGQ